MMRRITIAFCIFSNFKQERVVLSEIWEIINSALQQIHSNEPEPIRGAALGAVVRSWQESGVNTCHPSPGSGQGCPEKPEATFSDLQVFGSLTDILVCDTL